MSEKEKTEVQRQEEFIRWLHSMSGLPNIMAGAYCELDKLKAKEKATNDGAIEELRKAIQ